MGGDPRVFDPARWLPEAVKERKQQSGGGCPARLDNKMMSKPFGFGPRKCLGFRLAENEIKSMLSRLLMDWKITLDPVDQPYGRFMTGLFVETKEYPKLKFEKA